MTTVFPSGLDAIGRPLSTTLRNAPGLNLSKIVDDLADAIEAVELKVGNGTSGAQSPPASGAVLRRRATGQSEWGQVASTDVAVGALPTLIATTGVMAANTPPATISGISQAFRHLELRIFGSSVGAGTVNSVFLQLNGAVTGYFYQVLNGLGTAPSANEFFASQPGIDIGSIPGAAGSVGASGSIQVSIPGYTAPSTYKSVASLCYAQWGFSSANSQIVQFKGGIATPNAGPITSVLVAPAAGNWGAGSIVSLYGYP
jgi:hypothetical protein